MNQTAKDAVELIESLEYQEKWTAPDIRRAKIIAGLALQ